MDAKFVKKLAEAVENGTAQCLATVTKAEGSSPGKPGFKMLVYRDGGICGTVGGGEAEAKIIEQAMSGELIEAVVIKFELKGEPEKKDGTAMVCGGAMEVLLEPLGRQDRLYILGGGHCGMALSRLAAAAGFQVTVIDDRPEWSSREKHPEAGAVVCAPYSDADRHIRFSDSTYIVIMTHGHEHDELLLRRCAIEQCRYLGMIASKRKAGLFLEKLALEGIGRDRLARIFTPVGFDIGSETPAEIAVSILAQMIAVRNGRERIGFSSNPLI
jgi:xanthine dehydrogenase accessory factor